MHAVWSQSSSQALDRWLTEQQLLEVTVEHAGRSIAETIHKLYPTADILILAGKGFNGADALVAARHLHVLGHDVQVLASPQRAYPLAQQLANLWLTIQPLDATQLQQQLAQLAVGTVIVDGILGAGFTPPLQAEMYQLLSLLQHAKHPIISIDIPSGLSCNLPATSAPFRAQHTLCLGAIKSSQLFSPVRESCGKLSVLPLGLPSALIQGYATAYQITANAVAQRLPVRAAASHKGSAGSVWVIGGSLGMEGSAALAAQGALRIGAGLLRTFSAAQLPTAPEVMRHSLDALAHTPLPQAVALGMGLAQHTATVWDMLQTILGTLPRVIDADALQADLPQCPYAIYTPHPGEAARILGCSVPEITENPLNSAQTLQKRLGGVVVLKGAPSVIASAHQLWVNSSGHSGMSVAGMGDTLAGILAGLLAQGLSLEDAACCGVYLHGLAGELAATQYGYGLQATDVALQLGAAWQYVLEQAEQTRLI